jgi:hypothetical protein
VNSDPESEVRPLRDILNKAKRAIIEPQPEKKKPAQNSETESGGVLNTLKYLLIKSDSEEQNAKRQSQTQILNPASTPAINNLNSPQVAQQISGQQAQSGQVAPGPPAPQQSNNNNTPATTSHAKPHVISAPTAPPVAPSTSGAVSQDTGAPAMTVSTGASPPVPAPSSATATPAGAKVEFGAVYETAGIRPPAFTVEKLLEMLSRLPAELSMEQKRLTVTATLDAMGKEFGATTETIIADARSKVAALTAHTEELARQTGKFVATTAAEVVALQAQIEEKRKAIEDAQHKEAEISQACQVESNRLQSILTFFGVDATPPKSP